MAIFCARITVQIPNAGKMFPNTFASLLVKELRKIAEKKGWRVSITSAWRRKGRKKKEFYA